MVVVGHPSVVPHQCFAHPGDAGARVSPLSDRRVLAWWHRIPPWRAGYWLVMMLYAELPARRARQALSDLLMVLWVLIWLRIGVAVHTLVDKLAVPGRELTSAGTSLAGASGAVGTRVERVPGIGAALRAPFGAVATGGRSLQSAGTLQQHVAHRLALLLAVLVAVIPVIAVATRYLPDRARWVRDASATRRLRDGSSDLRLFALRALVDRPAHELVQVAEDPMAEYDHGRVEALAALELGAFGLDARQQR